MGYGKTIDDLCTSNAELKKINKDLTSQLADVKERLSEQIEDNGRIHDEKMKFWHETDDLKRQLAEEKRSTEHWESAYNSEKEFSRILEKQLADAREEIARLRKALTVIASYDKHSRLAGQCPEGCDSPAIAKAALEASDG